MQETTHEDRRNELESLLAAIAASPTRDWSQERKRVVVLRKMLASREAAHA
jgi:hypothetical protein